MQIYTIGDSDQLSVLRKKSNPIENIDDAIVSLADDMVQTMIDYDGIGLAGPQVGRLLHIFTVKLGDETPLVFINPQILSTSTEQSSYEEGCLSIPQQFSSVTRPATIQIQAWNTRGRPFTMEADGLLATVIQHELDHLNGVLFIDYISPRKRNKILRAFDVEPADYPDRE